MIVVWFGLAACVCATVKRAFHSWPRVVRLGAVGAVGAAGADVYDDVDAVFVGPLLGRI